MGKKLIVVALVLSLAGFGLLGLSGCTTSPAATLKVGVIGPMQYDMGEQHWLGAQMAAEEINAAGGVTIGDETYEIELFQYDSNELNSIDDAVAATERACTVDMVDLLVGTIRTEASLAMQEVAMDNKTMFICCGASHTLLSDKVKEDYDRYKYWFRTTPIKVTDLVNVSFILLNQVGAVVRQELGIATPKVAVIVEQAAAGDPLAQAAEAYIPSFGMEVVGTWRPSDRATDVTAELTAIRDSGANIIYTYFSGPAGVTYARQWAELQIPAASVGINVSAQSQGFMDATNGLGNYEYTMNTLARIEITDETIPFYDAFVERSGEFPTYNAGTYDAIYVWKEAVERAGVLDADAIVTEMEATDYEGAAGRIVFDEEHNVTWGPGYVTAVGTQWQDDQLLCCWPYDWEGITYEGSVPYVLPPWVLVGQ